MINEKISRKGLIKKLFNVSKLIAGFSVVIHCKNVISNISYENKSTILNSLDNIRYNDQPLFKSLINPTYTFDNFTEYPGNSVAFSAACAAAYEPCTNFNPLVIRGKSGTGKTHLLQAIGNKVKNDHKDINLLYITCNPFIDEFLNSIAFDKYRQFKEYMINFDLVLFDDIHCIVDRKYVQQELILMFNNLYLNDVQIVIAGILSSMEMDYFKDRLSKFSEWGFYTDITL